MVGHMLLPHYVKYFNPTIKDEDILPASLSKEVLTNLLREKLSFNGMVVTDATAMIGYNVALPRSQAIPLSIENGCDMILFNKDIDEDYTFMKKGLENGLLSLERLNEAVLRILATKMANGVFENKKPLNEIDVVGCKEHQELAYQCASKAITLVKNKQDIFDCIVERMYQIDNKRAKEYQVPESTIVVTPNAYRNTTIESLTTFTFAQYDFWVTDEFASNFRKMLILEQYRNLKMNMLYQKCLVNGPISYIEDIFNEMIKKGVHMTLYTITDWMGLVPIVVCLIFAGIGLVQLIKRRSLFKVDSDIIILGVYYGIVILAYSIFEIIPINYRPILIEGVMEASYPSSTTLLILCVMPTLIEQIQRRLTCVTTKRIITITVIAFSVFMVIGRLISGVHWFTDIVGGVILSMGLFTIYKAVVMLSTKNQ